MSGSPPRIAIRLARREDIPAIVMISNASVGPGEDVGFGTPPSESPFSDTRRLSAAWQDPNRVLGEEVWVAEAGGRVVGCVTLEDRGEALELINIDVPRNLQGQGIGTRMLRLVEERARKEGKHSVTLGTSRNAAGVAWKSFPWWTSHGYQVTREEENDWTRSIGPGVREIRMRKDLLPRGVAASDLQLRDVLESDLPIFFGFQRDPVANRMAAFTAKDPADRAAFQVHWAKILSDDTIIVKTLVSDGRVVGHVAKFVDKELGKPEVTYWIGREFWGRGLATKALSEFLRHVAMRPISGRAAKDNLASIRVLEKCGFRIVGYGKGFANARGEEIDEAMLELDANDEFGL